MYFYLNLSTNDLKIAIDYESNCDKVQRTKKAFVESCQYGSRVKEFVIFAPTQQGVSALY